MQAKDYEWFAVGDWLVQPDRNRISTATESVDLRSQLMEVLVYLARLDGQVATLESIHDDLWSGKVVSSGTIYNCIAELRRALSRDGKSIDYIETIPKKGYRLVSPVVARPVRRHGEASVAVLPLANLSGNSADDYLCEGIAEEVIHRLSKVGGLRVYSALTLKDQNLDARVVGLRFGVHKVLAGSLQKSGHRLRLTFRLDNVSSGETAWSDRYEEEITELFRLQDAVAGAVVAALSPALDIGDSDNIVLEHTGTRNLEAFNAFLLGRHAQSQSPQQGLKDAIQYFEQAVELDPKFARAHYCLYLSCYWSRRVLGTGREYLDKARIAAASAKKHGYHPGVPWIHVQRRLYRDLLPNTRELATEALDKIRNYDPEWGSFGYEQLTWVLPAAGWFKATLDFARHMFDSPDQNFQDSDANEELPHYFAAVGQHEDAIRLWSGEIQKDPERALFRCERSQLYSRTGQFEYAQSDIGAMDDSWYRDLARATLHYWRDEPEQVLAQHERMCKYPYVHPSYLSRTFAMLGDYDAALECYDKAVNSQSRSYIDFGNMRAMTRAKMPMSIVDQLENHPHFLALMEQHGVDDAWRMELMERVNELSDLTGIQIQPGDP